MSSRRNSLENVSFEKNSHAGLWFDKYIENQETVNVKSELIKKVSSISEPPIYRPFYERWKKMIADYCTVPPREAEVQGRMVIGMGDESVLETSVTFHHTYGVPYIPGSALKGLAASYVRQKLGEEWKKEGEAYKTIFGETDDAGYITFFDAYYVPGSGYRYKEKAQALYPDVITVHHQNYYQGGEKAPADWDSPIPVPFLSTTGKYLIALAAPELEAPIRSEWINITFTILEEALKTMGIGAKNHMSVPGLLFLRKGKNLEDSSLTQTKTRKLLNASNQVRQMLA
jgi:CRISPR-associated protein Cmr6